MDTCVVCEKPLVFDLHSASEGSSSRAEEEATIPDDYTLSCGHHYHWECLMEELQGTSCRSCRLDVSSRDSRDRPQILCSVNNEGGRAEGYDILPLLLEERYARAHPEEVQARAFLVYCKEGDLEGAVTILRPPGEDQESQGEGEDEGEDKAEARGVEMSASSILRYQDPLGSRQSALHLAVAAGNVEIVWLLLLLASNLGPGHFPAPVQEAALSLGLERENQAGKVDIRALQNVQGKTAADLAREGADLGIDLEILQPPT